MVSQKRKKIKKRKDNLNNGFLQTSWQNLWIHGLCNTVRVYCTFEYVGDFVMCSGPSMEPTLETNNILFTEHISPRFEKLKRGDIVIAKSPTNPKQNICKRIVGMPGDSVRASYMRRSHVVPRGYVWLEGDNSSNSADSRIYGPVPQGLIRSRVVCRVWPFDKISLLSVTE